MSEKVKCLGEKVLKGGKALESNKNGQPSVWSGKGMKPPPGADTAQVHGAQPGAAGSSTASMLPGHRASHRKRGCRNSCHARPEYPRWRTDSVLRINRAERLLPGPWFRNLLQAGCTDTGQSSALGAQRETENYEVSNILEERRYRK